MEEEQNSQMSFLQHLEELRWRLVRCAIAVIVFAVVIWWNMEWIMDTVFYTMLTKDFISYKVACGTFGFMCMDNVNATLQSTDVSGQLSYAFMMSIMGGFVLAFPFVFYQLWSFVKPGLKMNEKKVVKGIVFYVSILFFMGIIFGYFVVAPMTVQFFATFTISKNIANNFMLNSYLGTILSTIFYTGLFFLLPVVAYLLAKTGLVSSGFLKKYRRHAIVGVLVLAAVITPPDMISQIIVSIPIVGLYEIGIMVVKRVEKSRLNQN